MHSSPRKIIIIGATSGIGRELALQYLQQGAIVGVTGRRQVLLDTLQQQYPAQVFTACFDAAAADNIAQTETLISRMGGVDLFIYNAGYGEPSEQLDTAIEQLSNAVNVKGFHALCSFMFGFFLRQGHGHIAAVSSIAAVRGNSHAPAYSAGKAYISTYLEGLHMKARKNNWPVYITDIQPGFVQTKMAKGHGQFWVAPVSKAAKQIIQAIERKKWRAYITRRWWLIARVMQYAPAWLYHKIG